MKANDKILLGSTISTIALGSLFLVSLHTGFASIIISSISYNIFSITILNNEFNAIVRIKDSFVP